MSRVHHIAQRIAALLQKHDAAYCESCLTGRLLIASKAALRAALETDRLTVRIGICPDCMTRKHVIARRADSENVAA